MVAFVQLQAEEHSKAEGILRFMLQSGRGTPKQIAWLLGYFRRMQRKEKAQDSTRHS